MEREELRMLDKAITPDVARVLVKLLPELQEIISQMAQAPQQAAPEEQMEMLDEVIQDSQNDEDEAIIDDTDISKFSFNGIVVFVVD